MAQFRGGMNELMRQAARIQRKVEDKKKEVADKELVSTAVGDKVKATVTYAGKLARVEIDPEFLASEGLELALDGVVAAVNTGLELAQKAMDAEVEKITGGVKIPGLT
jgi:nucleoid-associated protein EbfC